ncbi:hypothetical protein LDENG_00117520 [Lucifuga dentata]|nr:hypothetical protein LDENG_00117520 [Lucifuga dentata]
MGSYSDSTSDLEEDFPVFDFLQPGRHLSQATQNHAEKPNLVLLDNSDAEEATSSSSSSSSSSILVNGNRVACKETADVMMISSDSDDDAPYVPLAQRLKQRQENVISSSSTLTNGNHSDLAGSGLPRQNRFKKCEPVLDSREIRTESNRVLDGQEETHPPPWWLPAKPFSFAGSISTSPAKKKTAKSTAEEIQASGQEAPKRKRSRERQQRDKEGLKQEQERQKAERKALAEAAKARRPEECMKYMVVVVDPGEKRRGKV